MATVYFYIQKRFNTGLLTTSHFCILCNKQDVLAGNHASHTSSNPTSSANQPTSSHHIPLEPNASTGNIPHPSFSEQPEPSCDESIWSNDSDIIFQDEPEVDIVYGSKCRHF